MLPLIEHALLEFVVVVSPVYSVSLTENGCITDELKEDVNELLD